MFQHLILLHGALGNRQQFQALKTRLSQKFEVFDFNFEGHGGSTTDRKFSIDLFSRNTLEFIRHHHIKRADIFGYSMGGYVALKLAKDYPEVVGKIICLGTKFNWDPEVGEQEIRKLNPLKIEEKVPVFANILAATHHPADWKTVVEKTAEMMRGLIKGKKLKDKDLRQIHKQVLITVGSDDEMVSIEESQWAAKSLPQGKFQLINGFVHPLEKNDPEKLASVITNYLKQQ